MTDSKRPIPGSLYYVTAGGDVVAPSGRILKPYRGDKRGHQKVTIDLGRKYVHQLVAKAFIGPCPSGLEVRHLNGAYADNRATNLAYGSRSDNVLDSVRHGTYRNANAEKTHCVRGHEYTLENTYRPRGVGARRCRACKRGGK